MSKTDAPIREWKREEALAHIHGWDFSHIRGRYREEDDLPWDYRQIVNGYRRDDMTLLDYDTGGGEFLLSLKHPYENTCATEGYPPNVALCEKTLLSLGVRFKPCSDAGAVPFDDGMFDLMINRHGDFDPAESFRLLKPGGVFITEQVGCDNDADLVETVLPGTPQPFPEQKLAIQRPKFAQAGFAVLRAEEAYRPITFFDVGAFVWFARIISWEFPGFSVDRCLPRLLEMQRQIDEEGKITGTIHRFLIVAQRRG